MYCRFYSVYTIGCSCKVISTFFTVHESGISIYLAQISLHAQGPTYVLADRAALLSVVSCMQLLYNSVKSELFMTAPLVPLFCAAITKLLL